MLPQAVTAAIQEQLTEARLLRERNLRGGVWRGLAAGRHRQEAAVRRV
ncbi:MAG: hypothetical protein AABO58_21510 [Acidobacteriota bacterium]